MGLLNFTPDAVGNLLTQMEDTKRRLGRGLLAPPDAFQLPSADVSTAPAAPVTARGSLLDGVANADISDLADPSHTHRKGPIGGLLHWLGADRVNPELTTLLGNDPAQVNRVKPGLLRSVVGLLQGETPGQIEESRTADILRLKDEATARDRQAQLVNVQRKWTPIILAARTPQERYEAQAGYAAERAAVMGPENLGTAPSFLNAIEPKAVASAHVPNGSWVQDADGNWKQVGTVEKNAQLISAKEGIFRMTPAGPVDAATGVPWKGGTLHPNVQPQWSSGTVQPGAEGGPSQLVVTSGPRLGDTIPVPEVSKAGVGGGGTREKTQIAVAANQAVQAHKDMKVFENDLRRPEGDPQRVVIGLAESTLAQRAFGSGPDAAAAMGALNKRWPRLANYVRGAKAIGVAERLITPRGGSNYLTQTEAALSGVGAYAPVEAVDQAEAYREALVQGLLSHVTLPGADTEHTPAPATGGDPAVARAIAKVRAGEATVAHVKSSQTLNDTQKRAVLAALGAR